MPAPAAYFLTLHGYGTRLHGGEAGSVDRRRNAPGEPGVPAHAGLREARRALMSQPPFDFGPAARRALMDATEETCRHRGWPLLALHVRRTHLHAAVRAADATPERVMNDLKSYGTRRLRRDGAAGADRRVWSRHGSTRYLSDEDAVRRAVRYAVLEQGRWLDPPPGWDGEFLDDREVEAFLANEPTRGDGASNGPTP